MGTVSKVTVLRALVLARKVHTQTAYNLFFDVLTEYERHELTDLQRDSCWALFDIVYRWSVPIMGYTVKPEYANREKTEALRRAVLFL